MVKIKRQFIKQKQACIKIQSIVKMYLAKQKYKNYITQIIKIQSFARMISIRRQFLTLKYQVIFFQHMWRQYKLRKKHKLTLQQPQSFWPASSKDSPSIFFVTNNDLIIEDDEDILASLSDSDDKEIEMLKIEYENKIEELQLKYHHQKLKKKEIQQKFHKKLLESEENNKILNKSLEDKDDVNRLLVERLNNLLVANFKLQEKVQRERKKGVFNKLYEFLFT